MCFLRRGGGSFVLALDLMASCELLQIRWQFLRSFCAVTNPEVNLSHWERWQITQWVLKVIRPLMRSRGEKERRGGMMVDGLKPEKIAILICTALIDFNDLSKIDRLIFRLLMIIWQGVGWIIFINSIASSDDLHYIILIILLLSKTEQMGWQVGKKCLFLGIWRICCGCIEMHVAQDSWDWTARRSLATEGRSLSKWTDIQNIYSRNFNVTRGP